MPFLYTDARLRAGKKELDWLFDINDNPEELCHLS